MRPSNPFTVWSLEAGDKAALADALRLKADLGEEVWQGLGKAEFRSSFMTTNSNTCSVTGSPRFLGNRRRRRYFGRPYFQRPAKIRNLSRHLGETWAASLSALSRMEKRFCLAGSDCRPRPFP